jgi:hypothetical protein
VARCRKPFRQWRQFGEHSGEALRDHRGRHVAEVNGVPFPRDLGGSGGLRVTSRPDRASGGEWRVATVVLGVDLNPSARRGGHLASEKSAHQ